MEVGVVLIHFRSSHGTACNLPIAITNMTWQMSLYCQKRKVLSGRVSRYLLFFHGRTLIPSDTKLPQTAASCAGFKSRRILFRRTIANQSSFSPRIAAAVSPRGYIMCELISSARTSCMTLLIWKTINNLALAFLLLAPNLIQSRATIIRFPNT